MKTNVGAGWAFRQIQKLLEQGVEVEVVLPEDTTGFAVEYKKLGVKVHPFDASLPIKKPWQIISKSLAFRKLVKNCNPDIIHCHFVTNIIFCRIALRKLPIPRLFQVPGPLHLENFIYRFIEIKSANRDDYWAGSCKKTCEIYKKSGVPSNRVFLAYYTADFEEYAKTSKRTNKLRNELRIPPDTILVGMIGYFYKPKIHLLQFYGLKGHEDFIEAMKIVSEKNKSIKAVIIGGPAANSEVYMEKMKKRALKTCGQTIQFTGFREDILELYPDLDIAVHPSRSENFGGAMESLSKGIPTITSDVGGFPEIIIDGVTGYMVKAGNHTDLANKILYVAKHYEEAKKVTIQGQKLILSMNNELSTKQIMGIYNALISIPKGCG